MTTGLKWTCPLLLLALVMFGTFGAAGQSPTIEDAPEPFQATNGGPIPKLAVPAAGGITSGAGDLAVPSDAMIQWVGPDGGPFPSVDNLPMRNMNAGGTQPKAEYIDIGGTHGAIGATNAGLDGSVVLVGRDTSEGQAIVFTPMDTLRVHRIAHEVADDIRVVGSVSNEGVAYALITTSANTKGQLWRVTAESIGLIHEFDPNNEIPKSVVTYRSGGQVRLAVVTDSYDSKGRILPRVIGFSLEGEVLFSKRYSLQLEGETLTKLYAYDLLFLESAGTLVMLGAVQSGAPWVATIDSETYSMTYQRIFNDLGVAGKFVDAVPTDDGFVLAGEATLLANNGAFGLDGLVVKMLNTGEIAWGVLCGGTGDDGFEAVGTIGGGSLAVGGWTTSKDINSNHQAWIAALTADTGYLQWETLLNGWEVTTVVPNGDTGVAAAVNSWSIYSVHNESNPFSELNWSGTQQYPFAPSQFSAPGMGVEYAATCFDPGDNGPLDGPSRLRDLRITQ